jgi:hypothetical protein
LGKIPSVEQIERSGDWVSARNNPFGFSACNLCNWRLKGCPYLPGRRLRARQLLALPYGQRRPCLVWFYYVPTLRKIAQLFKPGDKRPKPYGIYPQQWTTRGRKAIWEATEIITDIDGTWFSHRKACNYLPCSYGNLFIWRQRACPYLDGKRLLTRRFKEGYGRYTHFYLKTELDQIKAARAALLFFPPVPDLVPLREAVIITGYAEMTLWGYVRRGLLRVYRVLAKASNGQTCYRTFFYKTELEAMREAAKTPTNRITLVDAAKLVERTRHSLRNWIRNTCPYLGRPLDAIAPPRVFERPHTRFLILRSDVEKIRKTMLEGPAPIIAGREKWYSMKAAASRFLLPRWKLQEWVENKFVKSRRILPHARSNHHGCTRILISEKSILHQLGRHTRAPRGKIMGSAGNTTRSDRKASYAPLPTVPYPVEVANGRDKPIPVMIIQTEGPQPPAQADEIVSLGNRAYKVGNSEPVIVTESEDDVFQAFLENEAMDQATLCEKAGHEPRVLRAIIYKYRGVFAPAIRMPGKKGIGGYYVKIRAGKP